MPTATVRGCGTRVKGGIYAEVPTGPDGKSVEFFLVDPPVAVDPDALGITAVGVKLMAVHAKDGTDSWHVVDWIGASHYPNVADFVEEVRRKGVSRRLPKTLDYSKLDSRSRLILVHPRAWIGNYERYCERMTSPNCPKMIEQHRNLAYDPAMCAGLWWQDMDPDEANPRQFTDFEYFALPRPEGYATHHRPGVFASFPIVKLAVVRNPDDFKDEEKALDLASKSRLPITLEDL